MLGAAIAIGWVVGNDFLARFGPRSPAAASPSAGSVTANGIGLPERALTAVAGFVLFCVVLMVGHILTSGAIFSHALPVPVAGLAVLVYGAARGSWPRRVPWRKLAGAALVLSALFVFPVVAGGSSLKTGDSLWHMGWTNQLLSGEAVPVGPAPGLADNAYPWGFHALLATMTRLVPGGGLTAAFTALDFLLVAALPLGAACLARLVASRAGWAAAACMSLIGGWGWIKAQGAVFSTSPSHAHFGADLVVASPNGMYELFPPALPRELGLVLLAASAMLLARGVSAREDRLIAGGGLALGLTGLVSLPAFVDACTWVLALALVMRGPRMRFLALVFVPAVVCLALWAAPVAIDYVRYGGFVNVAPALGKEWAPATSLWSWGVLLPLGAAGIALCARARAERPRFLLAWLGAVVVLLGLAILRGIVGWSLLGSPTLLHQGRMWPTAHILGAAFGGIALVAAYRYLAARARVLAVAACMGLLIVGAISPALASLAIARMSERGHGGFVYSGSDFAGGSFVSAAAGVLGPQDVVRTRGANELGLYLWQYSGARVAAYEDPRLPGNDLRIRFADLARDWSRRMRHGGFAPDYVALPAVRVPGGADIAARGPYDGRTWVLMKP